jgi:hypothetical protein
MRKHRGYKVGPLVVAILTVFVLECYEARADSLIGDTVTATYLHDASVVASSNILVGSPFPEVSCPGGFSGAGICPAFEEAATIDIEALTIDLNEDGGGQYGVYTFNGIDYTNLTFGDGDVVSGFTLSTNLPGLTPSDVSFTGNSIEFNAEGLPFPNDYYIDLTLTTSPVPEPRALILLLTTLLALVIAKRITQRLGHQR